ncbi:hypothetical protein JCM8202v2_002667 [Rhodotorula sphaerocarpa]
MRSLNPRRRFSSSSLVSALLLALAAAAAGIVSASSVDPNNLPHKSEAGQYGYNDCGKYKDSPSSKCQTLWINSVNDFCRTFLRGSFSEACPFEQDASADRLAKLGSTASAVYAPPKTATIGDSEHFIRTKRYIQISGTGDFTKMKIGRGDAGGELDPHGADGNGNPIGAVVLTNAFSGKLEQVKEWHQFIGANKFCIRICRNDDPDNWKWCNHIYDTEGCYWSDPARYGSGFDTCAADTVVMPPGEYKLSNGHTSTFYHGQNPTPTAHPPAKSSQCTKQKTITAARYPTSKARRL